jgi:hypothetical protein
MTKQVFKSIVPKEILFSFLDYICAYKNDIYYTINISSYKKAVFLNLLDDFLKILEPYYYLSKMFYVTRDMSYTRFLTIIRQVCNINNIKYENNIKYINSKYIIYYNIYFNDNTSENEINE